MSPLELTLVGLAGLAAGFINSLAGSGTLVTFPTLLAFGVPPVTANVSNNVGLVPGSLSSALAGRRELTGQRPRVLRLGLVSLVGGTVGAVLLLRLPESAFGAIVPVLVGLGVLLVAVQPLIARRVRREAGTGRRRDPRWLGPAVLGSSVYGGYFGAAQGVILVAVLGLGTHDTVHRSNALKNLLAGLVNGVAAVVFVLDGSVDWMIAAVIAVGSVVGAQIGVRLGRRLPGAALRTFIIVVGLTALLVFLLRD